MVTKEQRTKWRELAENTVMRSGLGEYTPDEFLVLLDCVDELETKLSEIKEAIEDAQMTQNTGREADEVKAELLEYFAV